MPSPATIEEYIAGFTPERRAALEQLRATVRAAAPGTTEVIAYQMPALRTLDGRFLVSYAAFKHHYSLFPASDGVVEACGAALAPYLAGKGTIRFPADQPLPLDLIAKVVAVRLAEHDGRTPEST